MIGISKPHIPDFVVPVFERLQEVASTSRGSLKVVVHDGTFHVDDVLCVAILRKAIYDYLKWSHNHQTGFRTSHLHSVTIVRTRDEKAMENANFVLDVGCRDSVKPHRICFDHHQPQFETYPNGVKMAACGKLARWLYSDLAPDYYEFLKERFLYSVEAIDNGQNLEELGVKLQPNPFGFVPLFNPKRYESSTYGYDAIKAYEDEGFEYAVDMAIRILSRLDASFIQTIDDKEVLATCLQSYDGKGFLRLTSRIGMHLIIAENDARIANGQEDTKILLISFPSSDHTRYMLQVVPKEVGSFDSWIKLPKEWRGLRGADLNILLDCFGSIFVHPSGFLGSWEKRIATYKAAHKALDRMEVD